MASPSTGGVHVGGLFDGLFDQLDDEAQEARLKEHKQWKGVFYHCLVAKDIAPRSERFEFNRTFGQQFIPDILGRVDNPRIKDELIIMFPEVCMSPFEQQRFVWCLEQGPCFKRLKVINFVTGSPLIVGNFLKEQVAILQTPELRTQHMAIWADLERR